DLGLIAVVRALGSVLRLWIKAFDHLKKVLANTKICTL
ncbi:MAG: hypothetical protein HW380_4022, partial [Magnetococcales bacterium]|nr:hypothetical protein [Magnetococcales bacterium]